MVTQQKDTFEKPKFTYGVERNSSDSQNSSSQSSSSESDLGLNDIDKGYAWVACFAALLIYSSSWGLNCSFSIYFNEYEQSKDYFDGARSSDYSWIGGLSFGIGFCFTSLINRFNCQFGTTTTILLGALLQFCASMLASFSGKIWQLYLTQGVLQGFGLAFTSFTALTIIPQFFVRKRLLANGIASSGAGVGGVVYLLGMQEVMESSHVRWALRAQAIISLSLLILAAFLIKGRTSNGKENFKYFDFSILKSPEFALLAIFMITCTFGYVIVLYKLAHYTTSLGFSSEQGSYVSAIAQVGNILARPLIGFAGDRYGAITVNCIVYLTAGTLALAMWIPAKNYGTILAFSFMEGGIMGAFFSFISPCITQLYGIDRMPQGFAMVWTLMGVSSLFSPAISDALVVSREGSSNPYLYCSIFTGCCFVASGMALMLLRGCATMKSKESDVDVQRTSIRKFIAYCLWYNNAIV